jgi:hypothetical protein
MKVPRWSNSGDALIFGQLLQLIEGHNGRAQAPAVLVNLDAASLEIVKLGILVRGEEDDDARRGAWPCRGRRRMDTKHLELTEGC